MVAFDFYCKILGGGRYLQIVILLEKKCGFSSADNVRWWGHSNTTRWLKKLVLVSHTSHLVKLSLPNILSIFSILAIQEAGLFKKWQQIHWRFGENQCDNSLSSVGHSPTNLLNTVGMYFALATGIGVAFVVLLTEILVKYVLTHRIKTLSSLGLYEKFGFSS